MKTFQYLGDVFSGKISKQNILIGNNVLKLLKNTNQCEHKFVRHWFIACIKSTDIFFDNLLFVSTEEWDGNPFRENINQLNEEKIFNAFKLVAGSYLLNFLKQETSSQFIKEIYLSEEEFKVGLFSVFNFTDDNIIRFLELNELFENDKPAYYMTLYNEIFANCFDGQQDYDIGNSLNFIELLTNNFVYNFNKILEAIIEGKVEIPDKI